MLNWIDLNRSQLPKHENNSMYKTVFQSTLNGLLNKRQINTIILVMYVKMYIHYTYSFSQFLIRCSNESSPNSNWTVNHNSIQRCRTNDTVDMWRNDMLGVRHAWKCTQWFKPQICHFLSTNQCRAWNLRVKQCCVFEPPLPFNCLLENSPVLKYHFWPTRRKLVSPTFVESLKLQKPRQCLNRIAFVTLDALPWKWTNERINEFLSCFYKQNKDSLQIMKLWPEVLFNTFYTKFQRI